MLIGNRVHFCLVACLNRKLFDLSSYPVCVLEQIRAYLGRPTRCMHPIVALGANRPICMMTVLKLVLRNELTL
jgi:hypothetical protein